MCSAGITQYVFFDEDRHYVYVGYAFVTANAKGANFDMRGHEVSVGGSAALPGDVRLDVGGGFADEDYLHFVAIVDRHTERWQGSAAISHEIRHGLALTLAYNYTDEISNYAALDYTRHAVSLTVGYTF